MPSDKNCACPQTIQAETTIALAYDSRERLWFDLKTGMAFDLQWIGKCDPVDERVVTITEHNAE